MLLDSLPQTSNPTPATFLEAAAHIGESIHESVTYVPTVQLSPLPQLLFEHLECILRAICHLRVFSIGEARV